MGLAQYLFGISSEDKAVEFLKTLGYQIVERNFHSKYGEIDIIAYDTDGVLCFIEVKATENDYEVAYRVDAKKYNKILKTIDYYILKNGLNSDFRLDLITINKKNIEIIKSISL